MINSPRSKPVQSKAVYRKPQAVELSSRITEGGTSGPLELMMMTAPARKTNNNS